MSFNLTDLVSNTHHANRSSSEAQSDDTMMQEIKDMRAEIYARSGSMNALARHLAVSYSSRLERNAAKQPRCHSPVPGDCTEKIKSHLC